MRLINADDVIKYCCGYYGHCTQDCTKCGFASSVKNIPTAYDVDSVIEELETNEEFYRDMDDDFYYEGMHHAFIDAIDIVRRGGINEDKQKGV